MTNPCQRVAAMLFLFVDGAATLVTLIQSSLTAVVILFAIGSSALLALLSSTIRSLVWPTYFWDESQPRPAYVNRQPPIESPTSSRGTG